MAGGSGRSTAELIVLMLTGTVCLSLLVIGAGIVVIEVVNPQADTSGGVVAISSVITTLLGALLGIIAGRSQMLTKAATAEQETHAHPHTRTHTREWDIEGDKEVGEFE